MLRLNFDGPINRLSLGNVAINFLLELLRKDIDVNFFPVNDKAEFGSFDKLDPEEREKIIASAHNRFTGYDPNSPTLKVWHINGSHNRVGRDQYLYTFYEVTDPTDTEVSIVKSQKHVFFSSQFAADKFADKGCENVSYVPLGFDRTFLEAPVKKLKDTIHFGLIGKFEKRKNTGQIIRLWTELYGDNPDYQLSLLVGNPFYKEDQFNKVLEHALNGKKWKNVNILPELATNTEVAALHQSIDIDLSACNGSEGWNLPSFNSCCMGKTCVVGNSTGHKGWAAKDNSILLSSSGLVPCYDGVFFQEGHMFNQGSFYYYDDDEIVRGMKAAVVKKERTGPRTDLIEKFSYKKSVEQILNKIDS